jgi:peroxiredoxin
MQQILREGDPAPEVSVVGSDGAPVALAELWRERPLLLTFLRHYG